MTDLLHKNKQTKSSRFNLIYDDNDDDDYKPYDDKLVRVVKAKKSSEGMLNIYNPKHHDDDRANRSALIEREVDEEIRKIKSESNTQHKSDKKGKKPPIPSKGNFTSEGNSPSINHLNYNDQIYANQKNRNSNKRTSAIKKAKDLNME